MKDKRLLIACIGNIFLGDDAFGCEVARCLAGRQLPGEVAMRDFGIRGFDLAYALMDGYETTIFVDATPRGGEPGTVYVVEPDREELDSLNPEEASFEPHGMDPLKVLALVKTLGGTLNKIVIVGCEPAFTAEDADGCMGLSPALAGAVERAADVVELLVARELMTNSAAAAA
jgi:hydrogenase maturation protease